MLRRSNAENACLKQLILNAKGSFEAFLPGLIGGLFCPIRQAGQPTPERGQIV
jgi:hypothetical protein